MKWNFIDGTVAGTNITMSATDRTISYTYYGGGCDNEFDNPSRVSCSIVTTNTYDGEEQSIGSFYDFQAAAAGSAFIDTTDNTNVPDTFCPLGWQLPYSGKGGDYYDKSKSWKYLFDDYGIVFNLAGKLKMTSYPLSYIQSGIYTPGSGVYRMSVVGYYYSGTISDFYGAYGFRPMDWDTGPNVTFDNVAALSLRCASVLTS